MILNIANRISELIVLSTYCTIICLIKVNKWQFILTVCELIDNSTNDSNYTVMCYIVVATVYIYIVSWNKMKIKSY